MRVTNIFEDYLAMHFSCMKKILLCFEFYSFAHKVSSADM